jgi:hypothetical protein
MKRVVWLSVLLVLVTFVFGCTDSKISKEPALMFLQGIQNSDKNMMYKATNLTADLVNDSKEKLIHSGQYKQTEPQRKDSEYVLRISGEIDFFRVKLQKMLPKSAHFQITRAAGKSQTGDTKNAVHDVKITYGKREEAMLDKTERPVKEMVVHLQQATRTIDNRVIHEFSFNSVDFEKIAVKDFEVISYF